MPKFLDTRGNTKIAIGICARCSCKYPYSELTSDPNFPGLRVCPDGCKDVLDPYRLPARATEDISLECARPDIDLSIPTPTPVYANEINSISLVLPNVPWSPNTAFQKGAQTTPLDPNNEDTPLPQPQFLAIAVAGPSGAVAPAWPTKQGVEVQDGGVTWLNIGLWLF